MAVFKTHKEKMNLFESYARLTVGKEKEGNLEVEAEKDALLKALMGDETHVTDLIVCSKEGVDAAKKLRAKGQWTEKHLFYSVESQEGEEVSFSKLKRHMTRVKGFNNVILKPINVAESSELSQAKTLQEKYEDLLQKWLALKDLNNSLIVLNNSLTKRLNEYRTFEDIVADEIGLREAELENLRKKINELIRMVEVVTGERDILQAELSKVLQHNKENGGCACFELCDESFGTCTPPEGKDGGHQHPANQAASDCTNSWNDFDKGTSAMNPSYGQKSETTENKGSCFRCGQEGHWAKDCLTSSLSTTAGMRTSINEAAGARGKSSSDACYRCGQSGHWARDCSQGQSSSFATGQIL